MDNNINAVNKNQECECDNTTGYNNMTNDGHKDDFQGGSRVR